MRDVLIMDTHVHLWDPDRLPYPWLAENPVLNHPFGLVEYQAQTADVPIAGMIVVEADVAPQFALLETQWLTMVAQQEPRIHGIVAAAPVKFGASVRPYLAALHALGPLVKGVRRILQGEIDPTFCVRPDFIQGVQLLADYDFSFDLCIRHDKLPAVIALVRHCPAISFLLDHLGKPAIKKHGLDPWRDHLTALAALPNVACKISGLVTQVDVTQWQLEDVAPYVAHALTVFGPDRVLFGSDWPVLLPASSYQRWVEIMTTLITPWSRDQRRKLWGENAHRWYHLGALSL